MVVIEQRELDRLKVLGESAYPEEACAILIGKREGEVTWVTRALPAINVHEEPAHAYEISPQALIAAQRKAREDGQEIVGFVHSHPDEAAKPSSRDLEEAFWLGLTYGMMSVYAGTFTALNFYRLEGESPEGRRFRQVGVRVAPMRNASSDV
ncbi:Mov34/MPN/PAD-1 [Candidatus Koribacter versatilis Ellin345]|uniref:Mov34/MPN/PAD-1 n=1 Tax=Koribacter versatilis (strain Ellin345) TaxID=204669 RepID=Q1IVA1_KORVE|nr:M67 family metallopeptidase [Candidatus Koribacter versatilis]ABF39199.1 Mov34/MPN/PAD-1 [Candidatus Koribacter versatilis Ellin345]